MKVLVAACAAVLLLASCSLIPAAAAPMPGEGEAVTLSPLIEALDPCVLFVIEDEADCSVVLAQAEDTCPPEIFDRMTNLPVAFFASDSWIRACPPASAAPPDPPPV